ncbi:MAG: hypothetical protein WAM92_10265, partial [Mycobacterium sp.]
SRPAVKAASALRARKSSAGQVTRYSETFRAHAALSNRDNRQAFLRTLRSVVDHRGQAVCALNRLHMDLPTMIVFGDQDRCIPVAHAYAAHSALPGSRLHVLPGVLHHPQVECPDTVVGLLDDFIATTGVGAHHPSPARCSEPRRHLAVIPRMPTRKLWSHKRFLRAG